LLHGEIHLGRAETPEGPGEDVVSVHSQAVAVDVVHLVGTAALNRGPPGHPGGHRGVGATIGDEVGLDRVDLLPFDAHLVAEFVGMPLVALLHGPFPFVGHLNRLSAEGAGQGGPGADDGDGVVFAAEAPAHRCSDHFHFCEGPAQHGRR
jgi:hypothetical protein